MKENFQQDDAMRMTPTKANSSLDDVYSTCEEELKRKSKNVI